MFLLRTSSDMIPFSVMSQLGNWRKASHFIVLIEFLSQRKVLNKRNVLILYFNLPIGLNLDKLVINSAETTKCLISMLMKCC